MGDASLGDLPALQVNWASLLYPIGSQMAWYPIPGKAGWHKVRSIC